MTEPDEHRCGLCQRPLREDERATCHQCVGAVRADLHAVTNLHQLLPAVLAALGSNAPNPNLTRGFAAPLPGGDALVLLAGGSAGAEARRRWRRAEATGQPHQEPPWGADDQPNDPPSVSGELARWEDELRHHHHHPAAPYPADVTGAASYLRRNLTWAGGHHPDFAELADDLAALRRRLERVTGRDQPPVTAAADCFDCGGRLQRHWTHHGLTDDWTCHQCARVYDQPAYLLAVRARLEQQAQDGAGAV